MFKVFKENIKDDQTARSAQCYVPFIDMIQSRENVPEKNTKSCVGDSHDR